MQLRTLKLKRAIRIADWMETIKWHYRVPTAAQVTASGLVSRTPSGEVPDIGPDSEFISCALLRPAASDSPGSLFFVVAVPASEKQPIQVRRILGPAGTNTGFMDALGKLQPDYYELWPTAERVVGMLNDRVDAGYISLDFHETLLSTLIGISWNCRKST
jgi:hypothetical protein